MSIRHGGQQRPILRYQHFLREPVVLLQRLHRLAHPHHLHHVPNLLLPLLPPPHPSPTTPTTNPPRIQASTKSRVPYSPESADLLSPWRRIRPSAEYLPDVR